MVVQVRSLNSIDTVFHETRMKRNVLSNLFDNWTITQDDKKKMLF